MTGQPATARRAGHQRLRGRRAVEAFGSAAAAIGPIEPGMHVFLVTRGQFCLLDMIQHVRAEIGPSAVSVWTWAMADFEVEALEALMLARAITGARLIIDRTAEQRNTDRIDAWRQRFGADSVRVCKNHAKMARVWNDQWAVLIRGSMNLNLNPRFEQADITEGGEDFALVARLEDALPVLPRMSSHHEADFVTGIGRSWEQGSLEMFQGLKVWQK